MSGGGAVHFLIVILVFSGENGLPPFPIVQIPPNGLLNAALKFGFRQPTQFPVDFGGIDA